MVPNILRGPVPFFGKSLIRAFERTPSVASYGSRSNCPFVALRTKRSLLLSLALPYTTAGFSTVASNPSRAMLPNPPYHYLSEGAPSLDLGNIASVLQKSDEKRQASFDASRNIHMELIAAKRNLESPLSGSAQSLEDSLSRVDALLKEALAPPAGEPAPHPRQPRPANLGNRVEECVRVRAFSHFLKTGTLISPSECGVGGGPVTDEEYLGGACMGLAQDLSRYGVGRATARDVASVRIARTLVQEILDYLLKFDFRNGYLRRKYDGTKYSLKNLETLLYELSVTGATADAPGGGSEPSAKRPKLEAEESAPVALLEKASEELEEIRQRMEHRDALRETLIKKCRDGQKAAKQAIYALHRGDPAKAAKLLADCETCVRDHLRPIVEEEPPLRSSGSFTGVLEEYAEARLFYAWLLGKNPGDDDSNSATSKEGMVLPHEAFGGAVALEPEEYLGGLCDLTGEVGRCAVQRGTARDTEGVRRCLETNASVLTAVQMLGRLPGAIGKKMDQLRRSVEKLERMTYEMSLSEAAGGRPIATEATTNAPNAEGTGNAMD